MYQQQIMMLLNTLLLAAAILASMLTAGCNKGIFDDANYLPVSSRSGMEPPFCYGRKRQLPECDRPVKVEKDFKTDPQIAYNAAALQRLSWYVAEAPGNTSSSWVLGDFIYELTLKGSVVIPKEGQTDCRGAKLMVKIFKSPVDWKHMTDTFCYNPDYRLWLPKGYTPAKLGN